MLDFLLGNWALVWLKCRVAKGRKIAAIVAVGCAFALVSTPANAGETPGLRLGISGGLGLLGPPENPLLAQPDGDVAGMWSAGFGVDARLGVQISEIFALDIELFAETLLMVGDMRAGGMVEIAPIRYFAFALGGGVGTMWMANLFFDDPSADFASGVVRLEGRIPDSSSSRKKSFDVVFGLEGQAGPVFKGSLPKDTLILGGRGFGGFLWH